MTAPRTAKAEKGKAGPRVAARGGRAPLQRSNDRALVVRTVNFADSTHELPNPLDGMDLEELTRYTLERREREL